ncbi:MAG: RNA ligase RtcB family protein [Cyanobacteria bacterium P01_D01_bin.36]
MGNFEREQVLSGDEPSSELVDRTVVRVVASEKTWIEGNALQQLEMTAQLKGVQRAVGMPDLHAGKGCPIGAAFLSCGWIYPALVGNDIGCGMGLWRTGLKAVKLKLDKWAGKLQLDGPWEGDASVWLTEHGLPTDLFAGSMGTIGGGNHFAELQRVETIYDAEACESLGVEKRWLYLLVHSGSRGLGHQILQDHVATFKAEGLSMGSEAATDYLQAHNHAMAWAVANRALIAHRFLSALGSEGESVFDLSHNTVTPKEIEGEMHWLHRKGAAPADEGALVIPGSRGTYSYLVQPTEIDPIGHAFSLAHGAGRKWMRSDVKGRLSAKYRPADLLRTDLGGLVICEDKSLIYEEAPQAYKNIDVVIQDMVDADLIRVLARLQPVLSYKTRRKQHWKARYSNASKS